MENTLYMKVKELTLKLLLKEAVVSSSRPGAACCICTRRQARSFGVAGARFFCAIYPIFFVSFVGCRFNWIIAMNINIRL